MIIGQCLVDLKKSKMYFLKPKMKACGICSLFDNVGFLFEVPYVSDQVWITLHNSKGAPKD